MLLICQSVFAALGGSQPFFSATVTPAGTPPEIPQRWSGATFSIRDKAYDRWVADNSGRDPGATSCFSRLSWSCGTVVVRPQPGQANPAHVTHADGAVPLSPAL